MMIAGGEMLLSIGVVVMSVGLAAGVIRVVLPRIGDPTPLGVFLRLASVSGALAVGAGAMYIVRFSGGEIGTLVAADTAMVLASSLVCVGLARPRAGRSASPSALGAAVALSAVVAVSSAVLPPEVSLIVKSAALLLVSAVGATLALRNRVLPQASMRVLGATMTTYGVYAALRIVVLTTPESPVTQTLFSSTGAGIAAVGTMLTTGVAVGLVGRPAARPDDGEDRRRTLVVIGDWKLANAAFGTDRVLGLLLELRLAARDLDPSAVDSPRGVEVATPSAVAALRERMRSSYGWRPEETELLTDGSASRRKPRATG